MHHDVLDSPVLERSARRFRKGEVVLYTRFLLVAGDAERAKSLARTPPSNP